MTATARARVETGDSVSHNLVIEYLRRMAPTQTHAGRREFQDAANVLEARDARDRQDALVEASGAKRPRDVPMPPYQPHDVLKPRTGHQS